MADQPDQSPEESSTYEPEVEEVAARTEGVETLPKRSRLGKASANLRSWALWLVVGVGMLILSAGVLIGLAIAPSIDEDGKDNGDGRREERVLTFEVNPSGEWFGEGSLSEDGRRFRLIPVPAGKGDAEDKIWSMKEALQDKKAGGGTYIPYEVLEELIERAAEHMERLVEKVASYLEERPFGPVPGWPDRFGEGGRDRWFSEEDRQGEVSPEEEESRGEESSGEPGGRPFEGFRFPFGELLPGLILPEDCEVDFESLPEVLEELSDLELEEFSDLEDEGLDSEEDEELREDEDAEDLEGLFEKMQELFEEICETPAGS